MTKKRKVSPLAAIEIPDIARISGESLGEQKIRDLAGKGNPDAIGKDIYRAMPHIDAELFRLLLKCLDIVDRYVSSTSKESQVVPDKSFEGAKSVISIAMRRFPDLAEYSPTVELEGERREIPLRASEWVLTGNKLHLKRSIDAGKKIAGGGEGGCMANNGGPCVMQDMSDKRQDTLAEAKGLDLRSPSPKTSAGSEDTP